MTALRKLMVALFCAAMALTPALLSSAPAEARAGYSYGGGYSSFGSRGGSTYNYNGGAPITRSVTPNNGGYSSYGNRGGYGYGGFGGYHPFLSGIAGGLFGGWLGSMMFPHWGGGYGGYGGYGGGFGGGLLSIFLWLFLIWGAWRLFRMFSRGYGGGMFGGGMMRGGPGFFGGNMMGGPNVMAGPGMMGGPWGGGAPGIAPPSAPLTLTASDQAAFEAVLKAVQGAWGHADMATLRHYVTPEMLSYFSEQLSENQSQGVENHVEEVELINGDVRESWDEGNLQYATMVLRWRARDWTERTDRKEGEPGWLTDGDPEHPTEAREMWTFARSPGGHWLLSAIQQV